MKYFLTIAQHNGIVAGTTPSYEYQYDTIDEVKMHLNSVENDPNVYVEYVRLIKGEVIPIKRKTKSVTITENVFDGYDLGDL